MLGVRNTIDEAVVQVARLPINPPNECPAMTPMAQRSYHRRVDDGESTP